MKWGHGPLGLHWCSPMHDYMLHNGCNPCTREWSAWCVHPHPLGCNSAVHIRQITHAHVTTYQICYAWPHMYIIYPKGKVVIFMLMFLKFVLQEYHIKFTHKHPQIHKLWLIWFINLCTRNKLSVMVTILSCMSLWHSLISIYLIYG